MKSKLAIISAFAIAHFLLVWVSVGILKASGFVPFNFFGPPTHNSPGQTFLFILVAVLSYPIAWIADILSIPYNWFTVAFGSMVNSVIWGLGIGLVVRAFKRRHHATDVA